MTVLHVWVDGTLFPADQAVVSAYDRGFRAGEGVFETFRAYGEHVFRLDEHLHRAEQGAEVLGFDPGEHRQLARAVIETAKVNLPVLDGEDSVVRLTVTAGRIDPSSSFPGRPVGTPTVVVTSHQLAVPPRLYSEGLSASCVPWGRELPQVKSVSYLAAAVARRRAKEAGADEALLTVNGQILEGAGSNVFAIVGDQLVTPPVEAGLLAGVTRAVVLDTARDAGFETRERPLSRQELLDADEAVLTSTTREVVPLVAVDDRPVGNGRPGPAAQRLLAAFRREVDRERRAAT